MKAHTFLTIASLVSITACSNPNEFAKKTNAGQYLLTLNTQANDTQDKLVAKYGGTIISFHPESGFAIVSTNNKPDSADTNIRAIDESSPMAAPLAENQLGTTGVAMGNGGYSAWSGGWNTWSSGWNTWSGGWNTWSGGSTIPALPTENKTVWDFLGLPQAQAFSKNFGGGVTVAVIDTGLDLKHTGFANRLAPNTQWRDYVDGDNTPQDVAPTSGASAYGHGTAVAGIILQAAPRATILPIRILDGNGVGNTDNLVKAIDSAISSGAQIINVSAGSVQADAAVYTILKYARSKGVYIFASAGNNGLVDGGTYPAHYATDTALVTGVFGVGSIQMNEQLSSFSARGAGINAFAPGEKIVSFYPGNMLAQTTGTSFATPIFAGAMALAMGELPNAADRSKLGQLMLSNLDKGHVWDNVYAANPNQTWYHGDGVLDVERFLYNLPSWTLPTTAANLLPNPSFENGLSNWVLEGANSAVTGQAVVGQYALRLVPNSVTGANITAGQQITGLLPNTSYSATARVKTENSNDWLCFGVWNYDPQTNAKPVLDCRNTQTYSLVTIRFTTGPASTTAWVALGKWSAGNGAAFADDLKVYKSSK